MNKFFKTYSGILSILIIFATILVCFVLYGPFDINLDTMSDFAISDSTFFIFNIGLIIGILLNVIFVFNLKTKKPAIKYLLYLGLIGLNGILIFPTQFRPIEWTTDRIIHWLFTFMYFIAYSLGILIYSLEIKNKVIRNVALAISSINIALTVLFLLLQNKALTEFSSIILIGTWVVLISLVNRKLILKENK